MQSLSPTYRVGPHLFRITNSSTLDIVEALPPLAPFACSPPADEIPIFELHLTQAPAPIVTEASHTDIDFGWKNAHCIIHPLDKGAYLIAITPRNSKNTYYMECTDNFRRCTAHLFPTGASASQPNSMESFILNNFLMMLYAFNSARHHTLLMHASVIACCGKAYLFLGKNGTGESAHSSVWLENFTDCHLLNDDNPIVYMDRATKQVTVYSSPWSEKTPSNCKEHLPVGAFVRLEQAPQNEIMRESVVRAFASLLPSCSCLKRDREIHISIISAVTELATFVPVFHFKCLPDKEAAELCRKTITGV